MTEYLKNIFNTFNTQPHLENKGNILDNDKFQLPITYLPPDKIHKLPEVVATDLELITLYPDVPSMYEYLLKPKHIFAQNLLKSWNRQFTTDILFLKETQIIITTNTELLQSTQPKIITYGGDDTENKYKITPEICETLTKIWKETKQNPNFLETYNYMEWETLKHFNTSSAFLQTTSLLNMTSPIMSFILPFIILLIPFIILQIQGIPITFEIYFSVLKDIAKHHFIGKALTSFQDLSAEKILYIFIAFGIYIFQIYQNITICQKFYKNMKKINNYLIEMRNFLIYSIENMDKFVNKYNVLTTYKQFCDKTSSHSLVLKEFHNELINIQPFEPSIFKITEIGNLLKCYYNLHSRKDYEESLQYCFGFEGFFDNLKSIAENFKSNHISLTTFSNKTAFQKQYYPSYIETSHIKNDLSLKKNAIITGPNASGKTTMLKTTTLNIIFSQQFGVGFFETGCIAPYTYIHSYLNIPDTSGRDSLFQAESRRCKEILDIITKEKPNERHFCIFDELYSGTNPTEASKTAFAFLIYLSKYQNVDFILTTHYVNICKKIQNHIKKTDKRQICNYKMEVENTGSKPKYTYKMQKGISKIQGAIYILEEMQYPKEILHSLQNPTCNPDFT